MPMKKLLKNVIILGVLLVVIFAALKTFGGETLNGVPNFKTYTSESYGFSFNYPKDLAVTEMREGSSSFITINDKSLTQGIQIMITPYGTDYGEITEAAIKNDIPDILIEEAKAVEPAPEEKGLAFTSNNEDFGGRSREIWFVHDGFLYQLSTYNSMAGSMEELFGSWKFK